ncbi:MAG: HAD-IA family hydrolase [Halocynthiibacter sp.]
MPQMEADLRLVIFDVDGTLVDSQAHIVRSMEYAYGARGLVAPDADAIRGIIGLSLFEAVKTLSPEFEDAFCAELAEGYKASFVELRAQGAEQKNVTLFDGALACLEALHSVDEVILGIATGKSRRGLDYLLESKKLTPYFMSTQVADDHPSKPHPSMVEACLRETGVDAQNAVLIGDTEFDMAMAKSAGVKAIGVSWGYHDVARLGAADAIVDEFSVLPDAIDQVLGGTNG